MKKNIFCLTILLIFFLGVHTVAAQEIEDKKIAIGLYYEMGLSRLVTNEAMKSFYQNGRHTLHQQNYQEYGLSLNFPISNKFTLNTQVGIANNGYTYEFKNTGTGQTPIVPFGIYQSDIKYFSIGLNIRYYFMSKYRFKPYLLSGINIDYFSYRQTIDEQGNTANAVCIFTKARENIVFTNFGLGIYKNMFSHLEICGDVRLRYAPVWNYDFYTTEKSAFMSKICFNLSLLYKIK
jgi:hypothetical protein